MEKISDGGFGFNKKEREGFLKEVSLERKESGVP